MRWLVDGMNLIGSRPDGWWLDRAGARRRLVAQLEALRRQPDVESVAVVFDGPDAPDEVVAGHRAGIEVSFAGTGPDAADRLIAATVAGSSDPGRLVVVTSDRALVAAVRAAGAAVVGTSAFRRRLQV